MVEVRRTKEMRGGDDLLRSCCCLSSGFALGCTNCLLECKMDMDYPLLVPYTDGISLIFVLLAFPYTLHQQQHKIGVDRER